MDPGSKVVLLVVAGVTLWAGVRWVARRFFHIGEDPTAFPSQHDAEDPRD